MLKAAEHAWAIYTELRKETLMTQQLRARAIGFKITFVGGAIALILANRKSLDDRLLVVPAFAAMFFDFVITSYSISIKRIGGYARMYLEPLIRREFAWPQEVPMWEEFMSQTAQRQMLAIIGNLGITALASLPGAIVLLMQPPTWPSVLLFGALLVAFATVAMNHVRLKRFADLLPPKSDSSQHDTENGTA